MAVEVRTEPELELSNPVELFSSKDTDLVVHRDDTYDFAISASGDRFILVRDLSKKKDFEIAVMKNWVNKLVQR